MVLERVNEAVTITMVALTEAGHPLSWQVGGPRVTEWQPREGRTARGRQRRRWRDDLVQLKGATWRHDAQHRQQWRSDVEGYFQQWRDTAL
ncbi:endonuclease-reverse transcriptase [Elysia marginata]|uniref:Endonuclease-reverse transcriptase n=1 Tax=Elysia marginata TaxID=1093978 RepID=A0AAV4IN09_9GAST|nr:endonuclease-reverse transcriptase [Elysia marginata]